MKEGREGGEAGIPRPFVHCPAQAYIDPGSVWSGLVRYGFTKGGGGVSRGIDEM